jgi:hypothetical protein
MDNEALTTPECPPEAGAPPAAPLSCAAERPWRALAVAVLAGFGIEALIHGQAPGLGMALAGPAAALASGWGGRVCGAPPSRSALALAGLLAFFSGMFALRAGAILTTFNLLACLGLVLLMTGLHRPGGLLRLTLTGHTAAVILGALAAALQPVLHVRDLFRRRPAMNRLVPALRVGLGGVLALPLLLLFGLLFSSADAVFADVMGRLLSWDLRELAVRVFFSLLLTWPALGLLRCALGTPLPPDRLHRVIRQGIVRLGGVETITMLVLVNLLFLLFVIVQSAHLFGGADILARTGMSYSEYARRGFFELVTVAALVAGLVLAVDWLAKPSEHRWVRAVDALHGLLLLQTLAVVAGGLYRMRLYRETFGLTELRLYTTVFMVWIGVCLVWSAATVLRNRRTLFPVGAMLSGAALMAAVNLFNPDAVIARTNLARHGTPLPAAAPHRDRSLDVSYLVESLSPDAVPALIEGLPGVKEAPTRRRLAEALLRLKSRMEQDAVAADWRGWNWGRARALRRLREAENLLVVHAAGR